MKPGQVMTRWWQDLCGGRLTTPLSIRQAALRERRDSASAQDAFFGRMEEKTWTAPERLKAPRFMGTNANLLQWDRADWQYTDPRLMRWAALFIEYARKRSIPLYVHSAFRTEEEQRDLVRRGVSRTPYPTSAHNIGEAVDIVHGVYHWEMTRQEWAMLGVLGERALDRINAGARKADRLHLTWGGNWPRFWDPAHWEITDYRSRVREIRAGPPVRHTPRRILRMHGKP